MRAHLRYASAGGIRRHTSHQAVCWLRVFSAPKHCPRTPQERESLQREIESIDKLVHELYGLTEDEVRIVEGV